MNERGMDMHDPFLNRLLLELDAGDRRLAEAQDRLREAQAEYEVHVIKYAALRDAANSRYGDADSPYLHPEHWPQDYEFPERGAFRFVRMAPGDAAVLVLAETNRAMSLGEILAAIREGGGYGDARSVNAALQQKGGVMRLEAETEGDPAMYALEPREEIDPNDLPF